MTSQTPAPASSTARSAIALHPSAGVRRRAMARPAGEPELADHFRRVRDQTVALCQPLEDEDHVVQVAQGG